MLGAAGARVKRRCEMQRRTMVERDAQHRVLSQIDAAELIDLASALIRILSFKPDETPVAFTSEAPIYEALFVALRL